MNFSSYYTSYREGHEFTDLIADWWRLQICAKVQSLLIMAYHLVQSSTSTLILPYWILLSSWYLMSMGWRNMSVCYTLSYIQRSCCCVWYVFCIRLSWHQRRLLWNSKSDYLYSRACRVLCWRRWVLLLFCWCYDINIRWISIDHYNGNEIQWYTLLCQTNVKSLYHWFASHLLTPNPSKSKHVFLT